MDFLPKDKILETKPDTLQYVRKVFGLDAPGSMKDAVNILNVWVQKQSHFNKKDFESPLPLNANIEDINHMMGWFSDSEEIQYQSHSASPTEQKPHYLEATILGCKGSVERAKAQMDRSCTMRTLLPQFFGVFKVKTDFEHIFEFSNSLMLPKLTEEHCRVFVCKFNDVEWDASQALNFFRHNIVLAEYVKVHDYVSGFFLVIDFSNANLMHFLAKFYLVDLLRQAMSIYIEGYGMRIKAIHLVSSSKLVEGVMTIFKQALSAKVAARINVHKCHEELHKFISKEILPKDFGGEERSLKTLQDEFIEVLSSEEHLNYLQGMNSATTNEACRMKNQFTELYAGTPGTFRVLSVD